MLPTLFLLVFLSISSADATVLKIISDTIGSGGLEFGINGGGWGSGVAGSSIGRGEIAGKLIIGYTAGGAKLPVIPLIPGQNANPVEGNDQQKGQGLDGYPQQEQGAYSQKVTGESSEQQGSLHKGVAYPLHTIGGFTFEKVKPIVIPQEGNVGGHTHQSGFLHQGGLGGYFHYSGQHHYIPQNPYIGYPSQGDYIPQSAQAGHSSQGSISQSGQTGHPGQESIPQNSQVGHPGRPSQGGYIPQSPQASYPNQDGVPQNPHLGYPSQIGNIPQNPQITNPSQGGYIPQSPQASYPSNDNPQGIHSMRPSSGQVPGESFKPGGFGLSDEPGIIDPRNGSANKHRAKPTSQGRRHRTSQGSSTIEPEDHEQTTEYPAKDDNENFDENAIPEKKEK